MTIAKAIPSRDYLRSRLHYDDETGNILEKTRNGLVQKSFQYDRDGYVYINFDGKKWALHRIVWAWHYDNPEDPTDQVGHWDGNTLDNKITNLRLLTQSQNKTIDGKNPNIKRVDRFIYFSKVKNRFVVRVGYRGLCRRNRSYATLDEAQNAVTEAIGNMRKEIIDRPCRLEFE